ncbi:MAG: phage tail protein [Anaerolineae bacterium]|nr:phage tail protein [Anaerolineae bacterium]
MTGKQDELQAVDSLSANEFSVEIDGETVPGVFRVSGLAAFKLEVKPSLRKLVRDPIRLFKMVQHNPELSFNRWLRETIEAKDDIVRPARILEIIATDDGVESRRWRLKGAWISEVTYSDFDSSSGELVQETLLIQYDDIETIWPAAKSLAST